MEHIMDVYIECTSHQLSSNINALPRYDKLCCFQHSTSLEQMRAGTSGRATPKRQILCPRSTHACVHFFFGLLSPILSTACSTLKPKFEIGLGLKNRNWALGYELENEAKAV